MYGNHKSRYREYGVFLAEGIKNSDIDLLDKTIHDDLLCLAPDGKTITKQMDLDAHKAGEMAVDKLNAQIEDLRRINGDTAVSTTVYDAKGKMLGNPMEATLKYIRVWKMFDDGLKVIAAKLF
ncbi:MAG: nuclear transport factor 2 family protein [Pedobacter sp.]|nr:MAG: nuclear transport factor 2 family protein [Pedobacter sp.]